jgi:arginine exporter protein ArgO
MPRHQLADADTPFAERVRIGWRYPMRGAAPLTIGAITLFESVAFLPIVLLKLLVIGLGWMALYTYAFECLRHTADGYADPPEMAVNTEDRTSIALIMIQLTGNAIAVLAPIFFGIPGVLVSLVFAFVLPVITMSLTFDGVGAALNPATWVAAISRLGGSYMLLFAIMLASSLLQAAAQYAMKDHGPTFFGTLGYYLIANYLTIYNFHLMGALIHHKHEALGYYPESVTLAAAAEPDDDTALLSHVNLIARDDVPGATDILTERLREGLAPPGLHARYRELLRAQDRLPELLVHGQIWIAALVVARESRRALGVVKDCLDVDPAFLPDDTLTCGPLADTAAHGGMARLALHLALGYLHTWPRDMGAPHYGLLAVRMHERLDQTHEAATLARQLLMDYPEHPLTMDIEALLATLSPARKVAP